MQDLRPRERPTSATNAASSGGELERLRAEVAAWRDSVATKGELRDIAFTNSSGRRSAPLYTALDVTSEGAAASSLRARIRSRAAFIPPAIAASSGRCASSPASAARADTNARFKFLLEHGQTGLSTAFDFPTLMGYDSDHPRSRGRSRKDAASRSRVSPTWRCCSTASRSTRSRRR